MDQEQGGADEPESIQFHDSEEAASYLEGESQPTTSRAKPATGILRQIIIYSVCLT